MENKRRCRGGVEGTDWRCAAVRKRKPLSARVFLLEREYRPDGNYRHDGDGPEFAWPVDNCKWMLQQDPELAVWFERMGAKITTGKPWWQFW